MWTPGANPHEVYKAGVQLKILSGRYRNQARPVVVQHQTAMNWRPWNTLLVFCHYHASKTLDQYKQPSVLQLVAAVLNGPPLDLVQFILDAPVHTTVIKLTQSYGPEHHLSLDKNMVLLNPP